MEFKIKAKDPNFLSFLFLKMKKKYLVKKMKEHYFNFKINS